jgi:hypothetical protein
MSYELLKPVYHEFQLVFGSISALTTDLSFRGVLSGEFIE